MQHAVVATPGSVSQADEIKMLESFQEKFGLSYPLAILASVAPNIPQTGLLLIAPNGNVVDVLQMELQSLRMINSIVRK